MPQEIGYAAAYEAYRQLRYNSNVYSNGYTDYERQRETQRALAIAEGGSPSCIDHFFVSHASRNLSQPHACGKMRVVGWINTAYRWHATLLR